MGKKKSKAGAKIMDPARGRLEYVLSVRLPRKAGEALERRARKAKTTPGRAARDILVEVLDPAPAALPVLEPAPEVATA